MRIAPNSLAPIPGIPNRLGAAKFYIKLDELDREEFYRLKKVQGKKKRDAAIAEEEAKMKALELQEIGKVIGSEQDAERTGEDVLGRDDADIIF